MNSYTVGGNTYQVDENGNVYTLDGSRIKKAFQDKDGYLFYTFHTRGGSHKSFRAHRVIWEAFYGPIPDGLTVDHINGSRADNRIANLRLLTPEENTSIGRSNHYEFVSPDGEVFSGKNIRKFAREDGLNHMCMLNVNNGTQKQHKGWTKNEQ